MMKRLVLASVPLFSLACAAGQGSEFGDGTDPGSGQSPAGSAGSVIGGGGSSGTAGAQPGTGDASGKLTATIRDFKLFDVNDPNTVPDFENPPTVAAPASGWDDKDIVLEVLGADGKPVYKNAAGSTVTTHGQKAFDTWFRDLPGVNIGVPYPLTLTQNPATQNYEYDSNVSGVPRDPGGTNKMFFPIDDGTPYATQFTNQGKSHNYSFTLELHTKFVYHGGEFFHFRGDDDVFVFIDGKLAINLGGIHQAETADVKIDDLKITLEAEHTLDFFYAERHVTDSNLWVTTSLGLLPADIK
jgi:fibro-slime domain-containing protein